MKCPFCHGDDTQVIDSRVSEEGDTIRRRRRCQHCDRRFTTYERVELNLPVVVKRNGARVEFDSLKLRDSMKLALRKRPVDTKQVDDAVVRIEERLLTSGQREISTAIIGDWVMDELLKLDQVAFVRFASIYKSFGDIGEFVRTIDEIKVRPGRHTR